MLGAAVASAEQVVPRSEDLVRQTRESTTSYNPRPRRQARDDNGGKPFLFLNGMPSLSAHVDACT